MSNNVQPVEGSLHCLGSASIGYEGEGDARCCVCAAEAAFVSSMPGLSFQVCIQCHDNGDYREWFMEWFRNQYELSCSEAETPNDQIQEPRKVDA